MLEHEWDKRSVDFPLQAGAVVLDIGGYKGRWSKEIATRYPDARIYLFEPQKWAFEIAKVELADFGNVGLLNFGLGLENGLFEMEEFETDGASFVLGYSQRQQAGEGPMVEFNNWLSASEIDHIDLIMMNIEAYEFKMIPYMIEKGIMQKVGYFMCQFHPRTYEQQDEFDALKKQMAEIMDVYFDYGIMLMCWKAKEVVADQELGHKVWAQGFEAATLKENGDSEVIPEENWNESAKKAEKPKPKGGRRKKTE